MFKATSHCVQRDGVIYTANKDQFHNVIELLFLRFSQSDDNLGGSGGGTRTPDTRIMIPLL